MIPASLPAPLAWLTRSHPRLATSRPARVGLESAVLVIATVDAIPSWSWPPILDRAWVAAFVAVAAVPLRHRHPLSSWVLCIPGILWSAVIVAPLLAITSLAQKATRWRLLLAVILAMTIIQIVADHLDRFADAGTVGFVQDVVYDAVLAAGPAAIGLLLATRAHLSSQLQELTDADQRERILLAESIRSEERTRLAREMHDVVSHQVSLIALQAGALRVTASDDATRSAAATIRTLAIRTLDELRVMVGVLRNGQNPELAPQPRLRDIPRLIVDSGLPARLAGPLPIVGTWPEAVERAAFRTVQEGLTNARKHSPGAVITVAVRADGATLTILVDNTPRPDQSGRDPSGTPTEVASFPTGGHGLIGLRERAHMLGGRLQAGPTGSGGYRLLVTLPAVEEHGPLAADVWATSTASRRARND